MVALVPGLSRAAAAPHLWSLRRAAVTVRARCDIASVPVSSAVHRGTAYEEHVLGCLSATLAGIRLARVGGAHDGGIDLTGWWWNPLPADKDETSRSAAASTSTASGETGAATPPLDRIRVMVQCKAEMKRLGPIHIREIQGTYASRFGQPRGVVADVLENGSALPGYTLSPSAKDTGRTPAMGILASSSGFSKQCILQALACPVPLLLLHLLHPADAPVSGNAEKTMRTSMSSTSPSDAPAAPKSPFAVLSMVANDALRFGLLSGRLEIKWLARLSMPSLAPRKGRGRQSKPADEPPLQPQLIPALFIDGRRQ